MAVPEQLLHYLYHHHTEAGFTIEGALNDYEEHRDVGELPSVEEAKEGLEELLKAIKGGERWYVAAHRIAMGLKVVRSTKKAKKVKKSAKKRAKK